MVNGCRSLITHEMSLRSDLVCREYPCSAAFLWLQQRRDSTQSMTALYRRAGLTHPDDSVVQVSDGELAAGERLRQRDLLLIRQVLHNRAGKGHLCPPKDGIQSCNDSL